MTARCYPASPVFRSHAEKSVWQTLRRQLRDDDVLLHGLRFSGDDGEWEVDLVVGLPDLGFATIEVKGGYVSRSDGQWWQSTPEGRRPVDLEHQYVRAKHMVRRYLEPRWSYGRPRIVPMVALPSTPMGADDPSPGLPRSWVLDRDDLRDAARRIEDLLVSDLPDQPRARPSREAVDAAVDVLAGRGDPQRDVAGQSAVREEHVDRLTEEQYGVLTVARDIDAYRLTGGPGSGKTWLAIEQARRWAADGRRTAFVCYSRGLATWVRRRVATWPKRARSRVWVGTFHALGPHWGAEIPPDAGQDPEYWESELPRLMTALAAELPTDERFDAIVVDEAQDFADTWWPALLAARADTGCRLAVFGDEAQRVFDRSGSPDVDLVPLTLTENLRNSAPIGRAFAPLMDEPQRLLGGDAGAVEVVACHTEDAVGAADDAAVGLLDAGWAPAQVAVLTTWHRHPVQVERVQGSGSSGYWETFWDDDDLFYSTVASFKGLERPAVVLAVDGFRDPGVARETLCAGMSRARDLLVVCGDPSLIRQAGGAELARRLGW